MTYTIGSEPWGYVALANECIAILLTILLGMLLGYLKVLDSKTFVPQAVTFVFSIALPLYVVNGIGMVNFKSVRSQWIYIGTWVTLRAVALVVSLGVVFLAPSLSSSRLENHRGFGHVAVLWLALTWVSSVIMGIPISTSVFQSEAKGQLYGLLAGVSSFIFQLPLQLVFLECHLLEQQYLSSKTPRAQVDVESDAAEEDEQHEHGHLPDTSESTAEVGSAAITEVIQNVEDPEAVTTAKNQEAGKGESIMPPDSVESASTRFMKYARSRRVWGHVLVKVFTNPVILGIIVGFVLSASTLGPRFLNPNSSDFVPGLGWIFLTMGWFGDCVTPLSLFSMGVWMQDQGKGMFKIGLPIAALSMFAKLVAVPLVMVGLAKAFKLSNEDGRAAVLIAALPISMASFSLASHYQVGAGLLSENVALGTILLLPTMLIWTLIMDRIGLFPI